MPSVVVNENLLGPGPAHTPGLIALPRVGALVAPGPAAGPLLAHAVAVTAIVRTANGADWFLYAQEIGGRIPGSIDSVALGSGQGIGAEFAEGGQIAIE